MRSSAYVVRSRCFLGCIAAVIPYNGVMTSRLLILLPLCWLFAGCSASTTSGGGAGNTLTGGWQSCAGERPKVCTMIYDPVCGRHGDNTLNDYASPCNACADVTVMAWHPKTCKE
ncbi:hypothetical protein N9E37_02400 [Luminiphilus sp.]|nr:hypothetical protein [Luminiphilus sp.]